MAGGGSPPGPPGVPGYTVEGVSGFGGAGPVWAARDAAGAAVVIRVVAGGGRRLAALRTARSDHLAAVLDVVALDGDRVAVVCRAVPGPDLATVLAARGRLGRGEAAALLEALGRALTVLHARGLVHGDVAPTNILITPAGVPVLSDLVGDPSHERGTPGFTAPERQAGAGAGAPGDVWSAARTVLHATGADGAAADLLAGALAADPRQRPSAHELTALAGRLGDPVPVRVPSAADLAQARLRAGDTRTVRTSGRRDRTALRGPGTRRPPSARPQRGRAGRGRLVSAALLLGSVVLGAAGGLAVWAPPPPGAVLVRATPSAPDTRALVASLLERRDAALVSRDAEALARLTVPGGPAAAADGAVLDALTEGGVRLEGYGSELGDVTVAVEAHGRLVVDAVVRQRPHARVTTTADGVTRSTGVGAQGPRCVRLELVGPVPWRVDRAGPCP